MADKTIHGRIIHKHDSQANWEKATNFIPKQAEIIIYDIDKNYNYERIKIGDGVTTVNNLQFVDDINKIIVDSALSTSSTNPVQNKIVAEEIDELNRLVGDTDVASQISTAIVNKVNTVDLQLHTGDKLNPHEVTKYQIGLGNVDNTADAIKAVAKADKLTNAKTIALKDGVVGAATAFDGSANISIPVTDIKESYMSWGGKNIIGNTSPFDDLAIGNVTNCFAFLPLNGVTVEHTRDGGSTWITYAVEANFFLASESGRCPTLTKPYTVNDKIRITIDNSICSHSCLLKKILIKLYTIGIKTKTTLEYFYGETLQSSVVVDTSGGNWSSIPFDKTFYPAYKLRITVEVVELQEHNNPGFSVEKIIGLGKPISGSNMSKSGHLYSYDDNQNATFPAEVSATALKEGYEYISNKYEAKGAASAAIDTANLYTDTEISRLVGDESVADQIASTLSNGNYANQNAFSNVTVGSTTIAAESTTDTLTFVAGDNITLTPDASNDKITITAKDTVYTHPSYAARTGAPTANQTPAFGGSFTVSQVVSDATGHITATNARTITIPNATASASMAGLMSTTDKSKLDSIDSGANKTIVDAALSSTSTNPVQNKVVNDAISNLNDLVGDTAVATQISTAIASKSDTGHTHSTYVNQNAFSNVAVGSTTIAADSATDTLTLVAGSNITLTPDATNDKVTIAATDTVYTHPTTAGNKHVPSGGSSGQILRWSSSGTAVWGADSDTNYYHTPSYSAGLKVGTGTGVNDMYVPEATGTQKGVTIVYPKASCTTYTSDSGTCTPAAVKQAVGMFVKAGTATGTISVNGTNIAIPGASSEATTSAAGLMAAEDKAKLNGIQAGATQTAFTGVLTSGTAIAKLSINGTQNTIYAPNVATSIGTSVSGTSTSFDSSAIEDPYIKLIQDGVVNGAVQLVGGDNVTITRGVDGKVTISADMGNTTMQYGNIQAQESATGGWAFVVV